MSTLKCHGVVLLVASLAVSSWAAEEKITGVLEKTDKAGACCQIRDALKDLYFVSASGEAAKTCAAMIGRKVVVTGVVEKKGEDWFVTARSVADAPVVTAPLPEPPPKEKPKEASKEEAGKSSKEASGAAAGDAAKEPPKESKKEDSGKKQ